MKHDDEVEFIAEAEEETGELALKKLREKLKLCQAERQEFLETSQRLRADYVNLKRETDAASGQLAKFANDKLLLEIIGLADNFEHAFANKKAWAELPEDWRQGVEQIYQKLKALLKRHEVEEIDPSGQTFDPAEAQAVATLDTKNKDDDHIIIEVLQKGYRLHGRVIRPASVKIAHYHG